MSDLEAYWKALGHPTKGCSKCGVEVNEDRSPVLWRCQVCGHLVCHKHTLTTDKSWEGVQYFEMTLCSKDCWEAAGKPEE